MAEGDRTILVRMVVLTALLMALFFGYAALRRVIFPPPEGSLHIDATRVAHMQALLHAIRPAPAAGAAALGDTHACRSSGKGILEQRQRDIDELNLRLEKLTSGTSPFLSRLYRLDVQEWLSGAAKLPGGCERGAETLGALLWIDRAKQIERQYLTRLEWQERARRAQWKWGEEVYVTVRQERFAQTNPWGSLPGCALLAEGIRGGGNEKPAVAIRVVQGGGLGTLTACRELAGKDETGQAATVGAGSLAVPRDLALLASDLDAWRNPESRVYRMLIAGGNSLRPYGGKAKPVGLHVLFTFDPAMQRIAQALAECYVGDAHACDDLGIAHPGEGMMDGARARQVGIAIVDVPSGEVTVAASAESRCFRHDLSGVGPRPPDCPDLGAPARNHYREDADALLNHALFTVAPPGSTVKPIMAVGFLQDPGFTKTEHELTDGIKHSKSKIFLDWMFCREDDGRGAFMSECQRPAIVQSAAHALGWNAGCENGTGCGHLDVLFGRPSHFTPSGFPTSGPMSGSQFNPGSRRVLLGRMLVTRQDERLADMSSAELQPSPLRLGSCARAGWAGETSGCRQAGLGAVSESYGQGSARATPVGVAGLMAQLAASAQYGRAARYPHVVRSLLNAKGRPDPAGDPARWGIPMQPAGIDADRARRVLSALEHTHRPGGTASGGCRKVFGADCGDLGIAGKTGTTSFGAELTRLTGFQKAWNNSHASLQQFRHCAARVPAKSVHCRRPEVPPRPWRWYAGVFKSNLTSPHYDKAFAVLVERNWTTTGRIDQLGGEGSNSAAIEIGFHLIQAVRKAGT